jgi:hypothetical protein
VISPFDENGCLPEGIHDSRMHEAAERFGSFQSSDRRPHLWARLTEFIREAKACDFLEALLVDGHAVRSFKNQTFKSVEPHRFKTFKIVTIAPSKRIFT